MSQSPDDAPLDQETFNAEIGSAAPPADSRITIERFPDGLTIQLPPAGLSGAQGLLVVAFAWIAIVGIITAVLAASFFGGNRQPDKAVWVLPLFLSVFWLVGIGLLLAGLNMARRRAAFAITGGTLMVIQTGLFGSKTRDFEPGDVEAVRVGPSGMEVNDVPVRELQIFDGGAAKFSLLAGRSDAELDWLAAELRQALQVPTHAS